MKVASLEKILFGTPICLGMGSGRPFLHKVSEDGLFERSIPTGMIGQEITRYRQALAETKLELQKIKDKLHEEEILEGAAILDSQLQILTDSHFTAEVETKITLTLKNAEFCFSKMIEDLELKFQRLEDPSFRERFKDIQDVSRRVLDFLLKNQRSSLANIPVNSVIFANELTPSEIAEADAKNIAGFVCRLGSPNSHTAILARGKGIPFVSGIQVDELNFDEISSVIVDGRLGHVIFNPKQDVILHSEKLREQLNCHRQQLDRSKDFHPETYDGHQMVLSANVEILDELDSLENYGHYGVGLFRSEYMLLKTESFPSEEDQFQYYLKAINKLKGQSIVIRTFDLGGDKLFVKHLTTELNSYLGCRAIRFLLKEKGIFKTQLRAILRAAFFGNASMMFPMVSTLSELLQAKQILQEVKNDLESEKIPFCKDIKIGCMIEVPSAALIADLLAEECDFLSVGTNDLVQYALAVDRGNHLLTDLYSPAHPSVIRLIKLILVMAKKKKIPVSICGEVASDPRFTGLLMGLGVHELSVSLRYLPMIKNTIRHTSYLQACKLSQKVLKLSSADEIQALLIEEYKNNFPEDLLYNPAL